MLHALGLAVDQESAYRRLVELPSATASELEPVLDGLGADAAGLLAELEALGLASRSASDRDRYVAVPPQLALTSLLVARQAELRRAEAEFTRLTAAYRGAAVTRAATDVVDVVTGAEAVAQRLAQLQSAATSEALSLVTAPSVAVSRADNEPVEEAAVARGVQYRVVLSSVMLREPGMAEALAGSLAAGEQVRVSSHVPIKLFVSDRRLALVSLADSSNDEVVGALLVHPSGLLEALVALFELVWQTAHPVDHTDLAQRDLSDPERRVMSLLVAGLTDRSVAAQLGMSERSVQRHVRTVMDRVGAESRLQLGCHAAREGWF